MLESLKEKKKQMEKERAAKPSGEGHRARKSHRELSGEEMRKSSNHSWWNLSEESRWEKRPSNPKSNFLS